MIKKAPKSADWNELIKVTTKGRSKATSAVLIAPSATTHGNDMNQRLVPLRVKKPKQKKGKKTFRARADDAAERRRRAARLLHAVRPQQEGRPLGRQVGQARKLTAAPAGPNRLQP